MDRAFLIGDKIYLRPFDMDDVDGDYINMVNTEDRNTNLGTLQFPSTREALEEYVRAQLSNRNVVFFAVVEKATEKRVGTCKIGPIDWINSNASYGRLIAEGSRGKGYGKEVVLLLLRYAFCVLNLHKVLSWIRGGNEAAIKSNEKIGMKSEARLKEYGYHNGKYEDTVVMSMLKEEYLALYPQK